jgi:YjbE family integral membrane protein
VTDLITSEAIVAFFQVVMIDLALAGDNAIVIGMAAAGLPPEQRRRAIVVGIFAALVLRIIFASVTTQLLQVMGLLFAGGIVLLWVGWKMWRELRAPSAEEHDADGTLADYEINADGTIAGRAHRKSFGEAALQIIVADVSMSLDNVLAVAGAAREHPMVLIFGLLLSIGLMGVAANMVARLLRKHRWIAYVGLAIILYVAMEMIYRGAYELKPVIKAAAVAFL